MHVNVEYRSVPIAISLYTQTSVQYRTVQMYIIVHICTCTVGVIVDVCRYTVTITRGMKQ